jgi:hypothetical protein
LHESEKETKLKFPLEQQKEKKLESSGLIGTHLRTQQGPVDRNYRWSGG